MAFDWKDPLRVLAPTIASALGGPLAGAAVTALSSKLLGKPNGTEDEIAAVVTGGSPETLLKLKELEKEFSTQMATLGVELEKVNNDDRKDARARQVSLKDWTPNFLACGAFIIYALVQWFVLTHALPQASTDIIMRSLGTLDAVLMTIVAYFFGSSSSSRTKDEILNKMADK